MQNENVREELIKDIEENDPIVYVTSKGETYHTNPECPVLKNHKYEEVRLSMIPDRRPCKRCLKK